MMARRTLPSLVIFCCAVLAACGGGQVSDDPSPSSGATADGGSTTLPVDPPLVVVTTNILGDVAGEVLGDVAEVVTLMPPDSDPHSFRVSAADGQVVASADLLIVSGLGLEEGMQGLVEGISDGATPVLEVGAVIGPIAFGPEVGPEVGTEVGDPDPHFWSDPGKMAVAVEAMVAALTEAAPGVDAAALRAAADDYLDRLAAVEAEVERLVATVPVSRRVLVTNHHVLGYFAERYGFTVLGTVIPGGSTLASPSAADLADLVADIEAAGVGAIFAESSQPDVLIEAIADETGLDVDVVTLVSESLTGPDGDAATYLDLVLVNAERIAGALSR